ncbi:MAG: HipA N-terminal domain-containing protein, partial [Cyanobacteria bacterium]|nr:HipA N-terminal domain-containing protein [Cyanobacteriota bacterium]
MSQQLAVWLFEACVGVLSLEQGQLRFAYLPSWLENPQAVPLSQGLPLQNEPFGDQAARSFFAGLLPE